VVWKILCDQVLDQPSFASDPRFGSNVLRVSNRVETDTIVAGGLSALSRDRLVAWLVQSDIDFAELS
jgi:itaconate CoA-transferase